MSLCGISEEEVENSEIKIDFYLFYCFEIVNLSLMR